MAASGESPSGSDSSASNTASYARGWYGDMLSLFSGFAASSAVYSAFVMFSQSESACRMSGLSGSSGSSCPSYSSCFGAGSSVEAVFSTSIAGRSGACFGSAFCRLLFGSLVVCRKGDFFFGLQPLGGPHTDARHSSAGASQRIKTVFSRRQVIVRGCCHFS